MMFVKHFIRFALPVALMLACACPKAYAEADKAAEAAQGESHEAGHLPPLNFIDFSNKEVHPLVALLFNFGAVALIVYLIMRKPLGARFKNRKDALVKALEEAKAAKAEAEAAVQEARAKMDAVDREMENIRAGIIAAGEKEAERIADAAEARAERLTADAQMAATQEIARMAESVRKEIVERIVTESADIIKEKITQADRDSLSRKYLAQIGRENQSSADGK